MEYGIWKMEDGRREKAERRMENGRWTMRRGAGAAEGMRFFWIPREWQHNFRVISPLDLGIVILQTARSVCSPVNAPARGL